MGPLKPLLQFLFGKDPNIFDENGEVRHQLDEKKWIAWNNRIKKAPEYDWRHHKGTEAPQEKRKN